MGLLFAGNLLWIGCASKPSRPPTPLELKQLFYSLNQSNFSGYRCEVQSQLLLHLTDSEMDDFFKERFQRMPSMQEKSMLKKVKWSVLNSNDKQTVLPIPAISFFPSTETKNIIEKITALLTIVTKIMTLTYLETFADRPDLSQVLIGEKFFQVLDPAGEVTAELDFNRRAYRLFFGAKIQGTDQNNGQTKDLIEVTLAKLGSMEIPDMIELRASGKTGKFYPRFEVIQGFPQLKKIDVLLPEFGKMKSPYLFEKCEYLRPAEATN